MGRALNRATLPRDASGQVDLHAVDRSLAALIGSVPRRSTRRARSSVLLQELATLGGAPAPVGGTNGHAVRAGEGAPLPAPSSVQAATVAPASPPSAVSVIRAQPTDVRGVGRILPAPVRPEDIEGSASMRAPTAPPPSEPPAIETAAEDAVVVVREEVDLESLPPLDPRGSSPGDAARDTPAPSGLPAPVEPLPAATPAPAVVVPTPPPAPPTVPPAPARRPTQASIPVARLPSVLPVNAPSVAPAEVGAVFDEFLGSAPVEPPPRPAPPPLSIPRAAPSASGLPRRPLTMQIPAVRVPSAATAVTSGTLPRVPGATPPPPPAIAEAVEALEVDEVVEVEEVPLAPAPMLSRPPALPPLPPKKR